MEQKKISLGRLVMPILSILILAGCASVKLEPADFQWPLEVVLDVDKAGKVTDNRYSLELNVKQLIENEEKDGGKLEGGKIRIIRDKKGYYYVTAKGFKNIYIFEQEEGMLSSKKIIEPVKDKTLQNPAFNQRGEYIEFLEGGKVLFKLNHKGIIKGDK
jgi:hypothetical protein